MVTQRDVYHGIHDLFSVMDDLLTLGVFYNMQATNGGDLVLFFLLWEWM